MKYGDKIKTRRTALGWSQRRLARESGVQQPLISAIESGRRVGSRSTRDTLEAALEVRPSRILATHRDAVLAALERHGCTSPILFGSVAQGTDSPHSDIDILVTFPDEVGITDLLELEETLTEILTVPVDLVSSGSGGRVVEHALAEGMRL